MWFQIFKGQWRGPGGQSENTIYARIGVDFRRYLKHFKGARLHIFMALVLHMDEHGNCFPGYETIEEETGYTSSTINTALDELCEMRIDGRPVLLRWRERDTEGRFSGGNRYRIFPTDEELQSSKSPDMEKSKCGKSELEEVTSTTAIAAPERPNIFAVYERHIGALVPFIADELRDIEAEYPAGWFEDAVKEAVENNIRKLSYVKSILRRWQVEGRGSRKQQPQPEPERGRWV